MKVEKSIESMLDETRKFSPPQEFSRNSHVGSFDHYNNMYKESLESHEDFWSKQAENLVWFKKWDKVLEYDFSKADIKWFLGGKLNVSYNCLDRHLNTWRKNKAALIWEGEPADESRTYTYQELHREVCKFANVLLKQGIKKGDRIAVYMPMIPELAITLLACTRIGAIHSVIFGGFSSDSIKDRVLDSECKVVVTADGSFRSGKIIPLKKNVDVALEDCDCVEKVIVYNRTDTNIDMLNGRDLWWHEEMSSPDIKSYCKPEEMDAEDPLFLLYTSGSTGKPKGVLHTTGGYLTYVTATTKYVFDLKDEDTYWCTADIGWITGHSYIVYGPLSNGATSLMFEGVPSFPKPDRFWEIVEKYKVNIFYTAPTAIRAMIREGDKWPEGRDLSSLRLLGTVGEPINPEVWMWYYRVIGKEKCPIVDTWWQTETGGILITPLPGAVPAKPGSATVPFFGIEAEIIREDGSSCEANEGGYLVINKPWPGIMRTVFGDHQRFIDTYFSKFPGRYFTGDGARIDEDGYFWVMGRVDDVINVSGHRIGTAEIESALVSHKAVAEAAVVGYPHELKGESIYAYVIINEGFEGSEELSKELVKHVRKVIGPIATPEKLQIVNGLPKTRSGKIMRRILKKIAKGDTELGDTTTLAEPEVINDIVSSRI